MDHQVLHRIEGVRNDREHGAGWLSRECLTIMRLAAEKNDASKPEVFLRDLEATAHLLAEARPTMAPLRNLVTSLMSEVHEEVSEAERDMDSLRRLVISLSDKLIRESTQATIAAAWRVCELLGPEDTVITCSYSSAVCQAFKTARDTGKNPSVIVAESKSASGETHGTMAARFLDSVGIPSQLIPDADIAEYMSQANVALIGADAILKDGSVINGTPSLALALAAKAQGLPMYSVAESTKIDSSGALGDGTGIESGFDRISPDLITGIITEAGGWGPSEIVKAYGH